MKLVHLLISRLVVSSSFRLSGVYGNVTCNKLSTNKTAMSLSKNSSDSIQTLPARQNSHDGTNDTDDLTKTSTVVSEWRTLETQVGGHKFADGENEDQKEKLGIIDIGNSLILKSLQNPPRGTRELGFYEKAFKHNCNDSDLLELHPFLSPFHGVVEKDKAKFLKLTNLTSGFKHPCVIDIKMGRVTYSQEASPEKVALEISKYPPLQKLGFRITGMMIYDAVTQSSEHLGKPYVKNLTEESIIEDGLGKFFQLHNNDLRRDVILQVLPKLQRLESWFLKQKKFSFFASSLLIVYEGFRLNESKAKINGKTGLSNTDQNENLNNSTSINSPNANPQSWPVTDIHKAADPSLSKIQPQNHFNGNAGVNKVKHLEDSGSESDPTKEAEVRLIDFAHCFPADDIDHNFLFGLQKLIACLQTLLK